VNHLGLAREAALAGLGIANLPVFACEAALKRRTLRPVLTGYSAPFGGIYVVHVSKRFVPPRVRHFVEFAVERLRSERQLSLAGGAT
jgi:DNA-binding transcriptional LysR family regulator